MSDEHQLKNLPENRRYSVLPMNTTRREDDPSEGDPDVTDDGSGQLENDRIAAAIRKQEGYVGPHELAEMAGIELELPRIPEA